ncbi:MAG: adenosylmethionine decarboxylase [Xanthobacteraceae bacterium]|nr:adenosylmethionine decarboxylase [Xanthobacteraceae bacterium]
MAALSRVADGCHDDARLLDPRSTVNPRTALHVVPGGTGESLDHFVERDEMRFAGTHLIVDLWEASNLDDADVVEKALREAAAAAGATLLKLDLHCFTPSGGITGVAVLAESHISIHTWPERTYAAVDVFMCGDAKPHRSIRVLRQAFCPRTLTVSEHRRGVMP